MPTRPNDPNRPRGGVPSSIQHGALLRLFHVLVDVAERAQTPATDDDRLPSKAGDDETGTA